VDLSQGWVSGVVLQKQIAQLSCCLGLFDSSQPRNCACLIRRVLLVRHIVKCNTACLLPFVQVHMPALAHALSAPRCGVGIWCGMLA
jgi:hypothetical protein